MADERRRTADLAAAYEQELAGDRPDERRERGAFYTPPDLVSWVLDRVVPADADGIPDVLDPACGTGHFLVAAARRWGVRAVHGSDLDPEAVRIARERLAAEDPSVPADDIARRVVVADGLTTWEGRRFAAVVGNPPFLGQLRRRTAGRSEVSRRGLGAYTDTSAVFLHRALDLVVDGGVVALVQPLSVLAARDAGAVRAAVAERGTITDLWCSPDPVFEGTSVLTCVPVIRAGAGPRTDPDGWGALAAPTFGIPSVDLSSAAGSDGTVGDLAGCTADFRDQYYGLQPFVRDDRAGRTPLVTSGLIDPAELRWGRTPTRFARRVYDAPAVDLDALHADGASPWGTSRVELPRDVPFGAEVTFDVEGKANPSTRDIVRDDEYAAWVNGLRTSQVLSVIDACHSGGLQRGFGDVLMGATPKFFIRGEIRPASAAPATRALGVPKMTPKGTTLAAAREDQSALEGSKGSIFTLALIESLAGVKKAGTMVDVFSTTSRRVASVTESKQTPVMTGERGTAERITISP